LPGGIIPWKEGKSVSLPFHGKRLRLMCKKKLNRAEKEIDEDASFGPEEEIDEDEILEVLEYSEPGNPNDIVNYRPEEDDDESEGVRELLRSNTYCSQREKAEAQSHEDTFERNCR
jgi:hypothetical protein